MCIQRDFTFFFQTNSQRKSWIIFNLIKKGGTMLQGEMKASLKRITVYIMILYESNAAVCMCVGVCMCE